MLNTVSSPRTFKDAAFGALAGVSKALGSPRRLELVDLLVQGPRSVEALATAVGQPVPNTSQHLQVLKRARLVSTRRQGTTVEYRLAPGTAEVLVALRRLAGARSAELAAVQRGLHDRLDASPIDRQRLLDGLADGSMVLLDVRPPDEYAHAHISGALSVPLAQLQAHMARLPADKLLVATCRGPFCLFAVEAVERLRAAGRRAAWFDEGIAEWAADGGQLAHGSSVDGAQLDGGP